MTSDDATAVRDQIEFYRAQAPHYPQQPMPHDDEVIGRCPPSEHCLELASGTGRWTQQLLSVCERITAVDASPEMHERNRRRTGTDRVQYVVADLFDFRPATAHYDLIFAGAWLSHVPPERFAAFWSTLADALAPGGHVVMADDGVKNPDGGSMFASDASGAGPQRTTADGREFTIVKVAYDPAELRSTLAEMGWAAEVILLTPVSWFLQAHR